MSSGTAEGTLSHSSRCRASNTLGFSCSILLWLRNLEAVQRRRGILRPRWPLKPPSLKPFFPSCPWPLALSACGTISLSGSSAGCKLRLDDVEMGAVVLAGGELPLLQPMFTRNTHKGSLKLLLQDLASSQLGCEGWVLPRASSRRHLYSQHFKLRQPSKGFG